MPRMTLDAVIMLFGAIVALLPFLQLPPAWTAFFSFVAGIIVIGLGVAVRRRSGRAPSSSPKDSTNARVAESDAAEAEY